MTEEGAFKASMIHMYSVGLAAINLPLDSKVLEVTPLEKTQMTSGELTDNVLQSTTSSIDSVGASDEVKTNTTATLQATWIPYGSNRFTPPNIRRGEKVMIWRKGDSDEYMWSEYEYNPDLRKLETIIYLLSNTQKEEEKATSQNTVYLEVSTHSKMLHLRWNNSDGEPHAWDIQLNAKESTFLITDDIQNSISIESQEKRVQLTNSDGTTLVLDKKNARLFAPEDFDFECGRNMNLKIGGNWSWVADGTVSGKTSKADYAIPTTSFSKDVNVGGMTTTGGFLSMNTEAGGFKVNGSGTFNGSFKVNGSMHATGNITADGTVNGSNI